MQNCTQKRRFLHTPDVSKQKAGFAACFADQEYRDLLLIYPFPQKVFLNDQEEDVKDQAQEEGRNDDHKKVVKQQHTK